MQKQIDLDETTAVNPAVTSDPLLTKFLNAETTPAAEEALRVLMDDEAIPVIKRVAARKTGGSAPDSNTEDVISAAREQLISQLLALRSGERTTPILQFHNYVAGIAYSAWAEHLRDEKPRFSMLLNRLRYLLENRTRRSPLAIWEGKTGAKWCGLARLEGAEPSASPRLQWLVVEPRAAARDIFGARDWQGLDLAALIEKLFAWLGCAIELRDLVTVVADLLQISDRAEVLDADERNIDNRLTAATKSPEEEAEWNEYLRWLWKEIGELSPRQCASFLLNSNVLRDFELLGVASIRSLAPRFAMAPEHIAKLWQRLPLDDNAIADELKCSRQQVINLRRVARDNLGRAWQVFTANPDAGGKSPAFRVFYYATMKAEHLTLEEIKAYGERTLAPADALEISDHLIGCAECRGMLQRAERSRLTEETQTDVTYEELAAYIDNQLDPLARREVSEKLERSPRARRELVDLLEFKKEIAREESGVDFQKWILPIAAGVMIAAAFGWWNSVDRPSGIAGNLSPQLRETMNALTEGRFALPSNVADLRGRREQLAGVSTQRSTSLRLISPVASAVDTQTPVFRWNGIQNASTYRVTIVPRDRDEPVENIEVAGNQTSCVASKPLAPGETYRWEVQALRDGDPVAQAPAPPEPEALFCVLNRQQQDEVARERGKFGHSHLALGLIYARSGMIDEAFGEFRALEQEDVDLAQKLRVALESSQKQ